MGMAMLMTMIMMIIVHSYPLLLLFLSICLPKKNPPTIIAQIYLQDDRVLMGGDCVMVVATNGVLNTPQKSGPKKLDTAPLFDRLLLKLLR